MNMLQKGIVNNNISLEIPTHRCDVVHNKDHKISLVHGKFITTTHASALSPTWAAFLAKHYIPQVCHPHIPQTLPHVTFSCCPQLRTNLKRCNDFQISSKQSMRSATSSGIAGGICASKGLTSKRISLSSR